MFRHLILAAAAVLMFWPFASAREPGPAQTIQELKDGIQNKPPATYFALATELFRNNQKDEAAFWYFVGDIRYRAWLLAKAKGSDTAEDEYHFSFVSQSVGEAIFQSAGHHPAILISAIDRALKWDLEEPNGFTSKTEFAAQYERARQEMLELQQRVKEGRNVSTRKRSEGRGLLSW